MEIRLLNESDAEAWWQLRLRALVDEPFAFGKSAEEHRATSVETVARRFSHPQPGSFTLGGFQAGELIGMATFAREIGMKERHKGHIYAVYVSPAHRRAGVGQALLAALLEHAKQDPSLEQILLAVATCQEPARALYLRLGFEVYGTEPNALKIGDRHVDEDHMILRLT